MIKRVSSALLSSFPWELRRTEDADFLMIRRGGAD